MRIKSVRQEQGDKVRKQSLWVPTTVVESQSFYLIDFHIRIEEPVQLLKLKMADLVLHMRKLRCREITWFAHFHLARQ